MITPAASVKRAASTASATLLAVDLGATWTRACALADDGTVLRRHAARTPRDGSPAQLTEALVAVAATVHDALEPARAQTLRAIGVAATGPLDAATGVLLGPPNMGDGYRDLPLAAPLRERFGLPVAVERDTNAAALGEHAFGAAGGADEFLYLTVSSGIGGAVFARGRLLTGAGGAAGELGHTPVALGEPPCSCGTPGHLEAISSGDGIARAGRAAAAAGRWTPPDRDDGAPPAPTRSARSTSSPASAPGTRSRTRSWSGRATPSPSRPSASSTASTPGSSSSAAPSLAARASACSGAPATPSPRTPSRRRRARPGSWPPSWATTPG